MTTKHEEFGHQLYSLLDSVRKKFNHLKRIYGCLGNKELLKAFLVLDDDDPDPEFSGIITNSDCIEACSHHLVLEEQVIALNESIAKNCDQTHALSVKQIEDMSLRMPWERILLYLLVYPPLRRSKVTDDVIVELREINQWMGEIRKGMDSVQQQTLDLFWFANAKKVLDSVPYGDSMPFQRQITGTGKSGGQRSCAYH